MQRSETCLQTMLGKLRKFLLEPEYIAMFNTRIELKKCTVWKIHHYTSTVNHCYTNLFPVPPLRSVHFLNTRSKITTLVKSVVKYDTKNS